MMTSVCCAVAQWQACQEVEGGIIPNSVQVVSMLETSTINRGMSLYRLNAALLSCTVDSVSLPPR